MKNASRKIDRILIISFVIVSIISICLVPNANQKITSQDFDESDKLYFLNVSDNGSYLNYSDITRNATSAYRLFDSVLFTLNTSGFSGANSTFMRIEFNDITPREYEMEEIVAGTDVFTYVYIPEYDAPLGFHNISFGIFDDSPIKLQLNDQTTKTNITIKSN